jgi:DNA (cytosine-5)-methyltransferase 1
MIDPTEFIVDNFAGGGGASTGIMLALGRSPDFAVNHDPEAIAMHEKNHPEAMHYCGDVWDVSPAKITKGKRVGLAWFSPDCKHFSKAKNGKPNRSDKIRGLAWVMIRWAREVKPRVMFLENVEEFLTWGPLDDEGKPVAEKKGVTFRRWLGELKAQGYTVEWKLLRACDYGAPTTRKRLFLIARCDGQPIVWPEPTHGPGKLPYRTAADCIDFSLPTRSIFNRKKPLAEGTQRRIARGVKEFVLTAAKPFIVKYYGTGVSKSVDAPLDTVTTKDRFGLIAPLLVQTGYGERPGQKPRTLDLGKPMGTVVAGGCKQGLVCAFLAKHYGGNETPGSPLTKPFDTITCIDHHGYTTTTLGPPVEQPEYVREFLAKYNLGDGKVTIDDQEYVIVDIGMRMLKPRELFNGQGFPPDYVIEFETDVTDTHGVKRRRKVVLPETAQTKMCGNSVSPLMAQALVSANFKTSHVEIAAA